MAGCPDTNGKTWTKSPTFAQLFASAATCGLCQESASHWSGAATRASSLPHAHGSLARHTVLLWPYSGILTPFYTTPPPVSVLRYPRPDPLLEIPKHERITTESGFAAKIGRVMGWLNDVALGATGFTAAASPYIPLFSARQRWSG